MALKHVNAVIVGAGAGGGVVAKELAEAGLSVVLLERGKWYHGLRIAAKMTCATSALPCWAMLSGPTTSAIRACWSIRHGRERIVLDPARAATATMPPASAAARFSYGAMAWRFMEKDFRMRSTYGAVAGSTLEDWPIAYEDLEPYYEKAEWEIGVSGDDSSEPFNGPRASAAAHAAAAADA